jgi:hypothetical protein
MTTTLVYTGIACILAAILGGGLKAFNMELPVVTSLRRQMLLGAFGGALFTGGIALDPDLNVPSLHLGGSSPAKTTTKQPLLVGIYPSDAFGIAQSNALHKVAALYAGQVRVIDLQVSLNNMKQGSIDTILRDLRVLLRTENVLAVVGPSVTEAVIPVLDTVFAADPTVPTFLLSAASADTYAGRATRQPIFRLSAGIDTRAREFSDFVRMAQEQGTRVHFVVEKSSGSTGGPSYGEQLLVKVSKEFTPDVWTRFQSRNHVGTTTYTQGNVEEAFDELERAVATDQVIVLFGLGGDMKKIVERFYAVRAGERPPAARVVGWMNAWALSRLARNGAYHWPLVYEVTDAYFGSDGQVPSEVTRAFTSTFTLGPQSRDEIFAFDSGYAPLQAYLRTAEKFGKLEPETYYRLDGPFRQAVTAQLKTTPFELVSGTLDLSKRGSATGQLVYTQYDSTSGRWVSADIDEIFRRQGV